MRTSTVWRVEREIVRCRLIIRNATRGTHEHFTEISSFLRIFFEQHNYAISLLHGFLHRLFQALTVFFTDQQFVDNHFDIVVFISIHFQSVCEFAQFAIHTYIQKSFFANLLKKFFVMSFTTSDKWCKEECFLSFVLFQNQIHNLIFAVFYHFLAGNIRISIACTGIKQTQKVVNFGGCTYCGARIFVCGFLFDGNYRTQPRNFIHIRAFHVAEETACISRESLYIAALPFGKNGVESKRRFSASTQSGNYGECIARDGYINVFQIMNTCTYHIHIFGWFGEYIFIVSHNFEF